MASHTTIDQIIFHATNPPGLYIVLAVTVAVLAWQYAQKQKKEQAPPRELLAKHTFTDIKKLLSAAGSKPRKTGIYKGFNQIGEIISMLELPATNLNKKDNKKKEEKEIEEEEIEEKVMIAKYHKPGLVNKLFSMIGMYNIMIISSNAVHDLKKETHHDLSNELEKRSPLLIGKQARNIYIKDNISIQHHAGVLIVSTREAKEYVKNIVWKISHENATGQFVEFTKQLPYLNAMFSGKVEMLEKLQELEDTSFKDKIKNMSR